MKPKDGRSRVIVEEISPVIDAGRYPAKRVVGDSVKVTAAIFSDGHDHVGARLLYRRTAETEWLSAPFAPLVNDMWEAEFTVDSLGEWRFTVEAWVDHFDTWVHDLGKRLAAQPDPREPTQQITGPQDIPLALRIGANLLEAASGRAQGADAETLATAARSLLALADADHPFYESPVDDDVVELAAKYPDLAYSTKFAANSHCGSTGSGRGFQAGTNYSLGLFPPLRVSTAPCWMWRSGCRTSPRWASTCFTCRPSTLSGSAIARARTTR